MYVVRVVCHEQISTIPSIVPSFSFRCFLHIWFIVFGIMSEWSHIRCVFADPGTVPHGALPLPSATDEERLNMCVKCNQFKPPRAHHCSECGRCIVKMDHHCPYFSLLFLHTQLG